MPRDVYLLTLASQQLLMSSLCMVDVLFWIVLCYLSISYSQYFVVPTPLYKINRCSRLFNHVVTVVKYSIVKCYVTVSTLNKYHKNLS